MLDKDLYITKWWSGTHPLKDRAETILDTYMPTGGSEFIPSKNRSANQKLKRLRDLIHKHYRFYNDGDSFRYSGMRVGHRYRLIGVGRASYYSVIEETNKGLKMIEDEIENLVKQIWILTDGATK